jgi:tetraacyldisaccharide 4'-kinase
MPLRETPRSWLAPLGVLFGATSRARAALYARGVLTRERLRGPVISVGNLSVGGRGKTPVVARLAEILMEEGFPVSILSRGYRGSFSGLALLVSDGKSVLADAALAGDEPVMLARGLPGAVVAVGRRRIFAGRLVEDMLGPRVHLLDDGFQHLELARDLDVLCLAAGDLGDFPLPAGRLREFPAAVRRADIVLVSDETPGRPEVARLEAMVGPGRVFATSRRALGFFTPEGAPVAPPRRAVLLAGIASPERFVQDVAARGVDVADVAAYSDHHVFTSPELAAAADSARRAGADAVVTTQKDATRIREWPGASPLVVYRMAVLVQNEALLREKLIAVARGVSAA